VEWVPYLGRRRHVITRSLKYCYLK